MSQPNRRARRQNQGGFTLIELLVVVIILGLLAGVVVFAVRGIGDKGKGAAVASDERIIRTAEEASCAQNNTYADGPGLVAAKLLSSEPEIHTITAGDGPPGFPLGNCPSAPANKQHYRLECKVGTYPECGVPGVTQPPPGSDLKAAWATYFSNADTNAVITGPATGSGQNRGPQVAFDPQGNVYLTGKINTGEASSVPTKPAQPAVGNAFAAKFGPGGDLIYSTMLSRGRNSPESIAVDTLGNAYIVGTGNITATLNAYRPILPPFGAGRVNYLIKLNSMGVAVYSTYLWATNDRWGFGPGRDETSTWGYDQSPAGVALLGPDRVLVTGLDFNHGDNYPAYALRAPCGNEGPDKGGWRGFLTLMDTSKVGADSHVATTCGGDGLGIGGRDLVVTGISAAGGTAYVVGDDPGFAPQGMSKVVVTMPSSTGAPVFDVKPGNPVARGFAVTAGTDATGGVEAIYVLDHGDTQGSAVRRFDPDLTNPLLYPPHAGEVVDIAAGPGRTLYEIGWGGADTIRPTALAYQSDYKGGNDWEIGTASDAFLLVLGPSGTGPLYATYLGGAVIPGDGTTTGNDLGTTIAVKGSDVYVGGVTNSPSFPTTPNAYQRESPMHTITLASPGAGYPFDFFAARFSPGSAAPGPTTVLPNIPGP